LVARHLDWNVEFVPGVPAKNTTPMLVHPPGSYFNRPGADIKVENLFLASDYVKTNTDLASMEGANEAARRAVNAILGAEGSTA
ncbi:FAD-dependent oxidoreductase, partial [Escherichia coli]|uniref:FAD-dependent oxidoreductase n=1 Tax=Escherichia coli TaxID=562 RepID=UPI0017DC5D8E